MIEDIEYTLENSNRINLVLAYTQPLTQMFRDNDLVNVIDPHYLPISEDLAYCLESAGEMLDFNFDTLEVEIPEPFTENDLNEMLLTCKDRLEAELKGRYNVTYTPYKHNKND